MRATPTPGRHHCEAAGVLPGVSGRWPCGHCRAKTPWAPGEAADDSRHHAGGGFFFVVPRYLIFLKSGRVFFQVAWP